MLGELDLDAHARVRLSDTFDHRETVAMRYAAIFGYCLGRTVPTDIEELDGWLARALEKAEADGLRGILASEDAE